MIPKGKLFVFLSSLVVILYGVSAAFYGKVVAKDEAYKELAVFMDVLKKIEEEYVEAPDLNKVHEAAMRGLLEALDPASSYLSKAQLAKLEKRKSLGNAGVGLIISKRSEVIYVVSVQRDGVADLAGVRAGDYVIAIDGEPVDDKSILEVESLMHGAPGSKLKLSVFRGSRTKPADYELVRQTEPAGNVASRVLDGGVGILDVSSLEGAAIEQARLKLKALLSAGAQKLILDLRDCADGRIEDGGELANLFMKEGLIAYAQSRGGKRSNEIRASSEKYVTDLPLVVLINTSTAGAAEVTTGALKDSKRATVAGERSFGLGSIQESFGLESGGRLTLSVAKYHTPAGKMIQEENARNAGIRPDVESPSADRRQDLLVDAYYDQQDDAVKYKQLIERISKEQLDKALEILARMQPAEKKAA